LDEVQESVQYLADEEKTNISNLLKAGVIEDYWFKVLTARGRLSEDIFETDHPLLKKLTKIVHIPENEGENFELAFHFAPNDFFENDVLKVKFFMLEDGQEPEKTEATEIKWKQDKDITKKKIQKKQKNKKTGKTRTVDKVVDADSFFNLFRTISGPAGGADGGDEDDDAGDENVEKLNINCDIAVTIQEEIIPYHLEYYLGLRKGDYDEMGGLGAEGDDDGDDDDEEDEPKPRKDSGKGKGKRGSGTAAGAGPAAGGKAGEKPECKQQ